MKACKHCQYFRETPAHLAEMFGCRHSHYCSSIRSSMNMCRVMPDDWCNQFSERDKKAPLWMRIMRKVLQWMQKTKP
jgi:hypothetical protein